MSPYSPPEAAILLVSTNRDLWPPTTHIVKSNKSDWLKITERVLYACSNIGTGQGSEVSIPGAEQKDCGLWGRECCESESGVGQNDAFADNDLNTTLTFGLNHSSTCRETNK